MSVLRDTACSFLASSSAPSAVPWAMTRWLPAAVAPRRPATMPYGSSGGSAPTAGSGMTGTLATVTRPDGKVQVTYDGSPLYEFTQDGGPGQAKGNGFKDSFNNARFTWHAATPSGAAPTGPAPTNTGNDNGYGY